MNKATQEMLTRLTKVLLDTGSMGGLSVAMQDAADLRRISMTLHRWHELECGAGNGGIERDETTNKPYWYPATGDAEFRKSRWPIADREAGALKRLAVIMARYPSLQSYVQGDPRGASLYILRPGDIPAGASIDSCYSNGVAVFK